MKKFIITGLCVSGLLVAGSVMAESKAKARPQEVTAAGAMLQEQAEKELGLSLEQKVKMKALREEFADKQKTLREGLKAKREALRVELGSDAPDRGKADGLVADINALQGKMNMNRVDQVFKMREILTPEQFKKFKQRRENKKVEGKKNGKVRGRLAERLKGKK